ncbi:uncharacterized protein [Aristolochia californica]|uniref:uncharacterized protein isoform X2 n=1 Tax=Aristolochia californica TaxID=171875 RepID=UPI0035D6F639
MSGGSGSVIPVGYMRQRCNNGYASSGDELEDGMLSRTPTSSAIPRPRTWMKVIENILWMTSAVYIIYLGDRHSNLIHVFCLDDRIKRLPFYFGFIGIFLNLGIVLFTNFFTRDTRKADDRWVPLPLSLAPVVTLVGVLSFFLFSFALWPIWSFLTLPLLYLLAGLGRIQVYTFRAD